MNQPFLKWYPTDWRADPRLRMCSLAARGLWIELIGYMHEGEPYGHLNINGLSPSTEDIASLVGRPLAEVRKALAELEAKQVYSKSDDSQIYSRRMVRDKAKADRDKQNGKGGGNPRLKMGVNPQDKAHILEARSQKDDAPSGATTTGTAYAFEDGVIRLNDRDFETWRRAFSNLDLAAELLSLSKWAESEGKNWFHAVKGALAKRNREVKAIREKPAPKANQPNWIDGIEGVL